MIISASRRTDIPAFHCEWFMTRLRAGYCVAVNPWNPNQVSRIPLTREDVDAIVFWSKNPAPLMRHLDEIDRLGIPYYFLFTLNSYLAALEPNVPPLSERIGTFRSLTDRLGKQRVVWRYDPIVLSERMGRDYHAESFGSIARELRGGTERVIVSIVDFYRKTERRLREIENRTGDRFHRDPFRVPWLGELATTLARIAGDAGMEIQSCADDGLSRFGIKPGKCIDDALIRRVFGTTAPHTRDPGQREECLCAVSRDIGANDTCLHGCEYCYSTTARAAALRTGDGFDPGAEALCGKR